MSAKRRGPGKMGWTLIGLIVLAIVGFALWRWAVAAGSAGTLDWIDARFPRDRGVELAAEGSYGPARAQRAEIWVPEGAAPAGGFPLVAFIHGGGWHSGAPEDYRFVARSLGERGIATALIGYRLVPEGRYPAMLEDSAAGLAWVREQARAANIRAGRTVLIGHSAGAYNVLMLGLDPQFLTGAGVPRDSVAGVVSMAGPADFFPFDTESSRNAFGHVADGRITQPVAYATSENLADAPPILLLHGMEDETVRPYNARNLHAAMREAGGAVELIEFEGMSHAGIVMGLSKPFAQDGTVLDPILTFVARQTAGAPQASVPVQGETR
ncbi:MAG: alpha/beta hydrolase [Erythrobacter sp.]|nr:alpha/beta hydrolase [Erythrobacter sp.]